MITKTSRSVTSSRTPVTAGRSITANARTRQASNANVSAQRANSRMQTLTASQQAFVRQLQNNIRKLTPVNAATNTSNIYARPDFVELLPLFVQKLLILDVFGSVAMKSRQQLIPYFKVMAENTKGETKAGTIMNSPFINRQGNDMNFGSRVVKNEVVAEGTYAEALGLVYTPILPGSVTIAVNDGDTTSKVVDDAQGNLVKDGSAIGYINYTTGDIDLGEAVPAEGAGYVKATYQYDNETVGPDESGRYGAKMGKMYLQLDEFNLVAQAHELACYWSLYSAFAAQTEYGANIGDMAKDAAFSELTAEINSRGFEELRKAASYKPQYNWDVSPVLSGSVVPSDYLNMFKLKLGQASASVYQATRLSRPNRLITGTNVATYLQMINGFRADNVEETVGPYKLGTLDQFEVYVEPAYDPNTWVLCAKSNDIRRNSALFGEYMPLVNTDQIGLADMSNQQGYATMYSMKVVNPDTVVSGRIVGTF